MQNEKMREEFEAWRLGVFCGGEQRLKKCANAPEVYYYTEVQAAWQAWQASRESLVVELPVCETSFPQLPIPYMQACREAIEAAGLKVKP